MGLMIPNAIDRTPSSWSMLLEMARTRENQSPPRRTVFLSETGAAKNQYLLNQWTNIAVIGLIPKS